MGQTLPKPGLRPFLAADAPVLAAIFVASIEQLTGDDYSEAQQQAWAGVADDEEKFGKRLASELTLVGQGVASMLCDALEKLAGGRGAKSLTADVSDNATEFFAKRGYAPTQRNTVTVNGEWLANTTMQKALVPASPGGPT